MGVSLSGVEPWRADDRLPPDTYLMRPVTIERDTSKAGNPMVVVDWRVQSGEFKGAEQRDRVTFTKDADGRLAMVFEACGFPRGEGWESWEEAADWFAKELRKANPLVEAKIREEEWTGQDGETRTSTKIKSYQKHTASDVPSDGFGQPPAVKDESLPF